MAQDCVKVRHQFKATVSMSKLQTQFKFHCVGKQRKFAAEFKFGSYLYKLLVSLTWRQSEALFSQKAISCKKTLKREGNTVPFMKIHHF